MKEMKLMIFFIMINVSYCSLGRSNEVYWNTSRGDTIPTVEIGFEGEILIIHLREAPYCHLWLTHHCLCFMLREFDEGPDWILASFSYCDGDIRGHFRNRTEFFAIETVSHENTPRYNVTNYHLKDNGTYHPIDNIFTLHGQSDFGESSQYFKPLSESGLKDHETGYIPCLFVIDEKVFRTQERDRIDFFLQDLVNDGNKYLNEFNFVAVFMGWKLARTEDTLINSQEDIERFILQNHRYYIENGTRGLVILLNTQTYDPVMGLALQDSICRPSIGLFLLYDWTVDDEPFYRRWQPLVFVHEIGHTLGLIHTDLIPECNSTPPGKYYIMEPGLRPGFLDLVWSNCSSQVIQKQRPTYFCLREKMKPPKKSCRNGVLEDGEQCECVTEDCRKCCDDKCQLTTNSVCSSGPCCDVKTCKPRGKKEKYWCRKARDSCDIPEMCDGTSAECPSNYVVANGYECGDSSDQAYCFNGRCGRRKDACTWVFEDGLVSDEKCFKHNMETLEFYGCGPRFPYTENASSYACEEKDMYCGKIFCGCRANCSYTKSFMIAWSESRIQPYTFDGCTFLKVGNNTHLLLEDSTFVQNGSVCGSGKMCVLQKCIHLPLGCPTDCPGELVQDPVTLQWLPAFILPESGFGPAYEPEKPILGSQYWFYGLIPILALLFSLIMLLIHKKQSKKQKAHSKTSEASSLKHQKESPQKKNRDRNTRNKIEIGNKK